MTDLWRLSMVLAAFIVLSGCLGGINGDVGGVASPETVMTTPTTTGTATNTDSESDGAALVTETPTAASTASATETATAAATGTPSPTATATPTPAPTATLSPTPTPEDQESQPEYAEQFIDEIENEGIGVVDLELADDTWMLTYRSSGGPWGDNADELETVTSAYCGLFEDGMERGMNGSSWFEATVLGADGDVRYDWYIDSYWCSGGNDDGGLSDDELMAAVFGTVRADE